MPLKLGGSLLYKVTNLAYEEIGLFPRSFSRVFDRFFKQLFSDVENLVLQEYRFYRYLFLTTVKCIFILLFVPFLVNLLAKNYLVRPLTEYFWNTKQTEIFLNAYQQKHAFSELQDFEETLYFKSLVLPNSIVSTAEQNKPKEEGASITNIKKAGDGNDGGPRSPNFSWQVRYGTGRTQKLSPNILVHYVGEESRVRDGTVRTPRSGPKYNSAIEGHQKRTPVLIVEGLEKKQTLQDKTVELAITYNNQSIEAITNFFADLISFITLCYLLVAMQIQINITKSFLFEIFFSLPDSKKSVLILLVTDLLVGYHSDGPWAILFQEVLNHYGLPESQTGVFLLVATLPVLLDVLFKYLIFRHLNRSSPTTVATYHAMIE